MLRGFLGLGKQYGGPVWDFGPVVNDVPASIWPEPTPENVRGIIKTMMDQLPEGVEHPERLSLRELAGLAIRPTFEDLPEETRALVEEISPGFLEQQL